VAANTRGRALQAAGPFSGKVFVLTGTLSSLTRAQATALIESAGGAVKPTVTHDTTHVVAGEGAGAKLARARELGVTVLDEAGFRVLLAGEKERSSDRETL